MCVASSWLDLLEGWDNRLFEVSDSNLLSTRHESERERERERERDRERDRQTDRQTDRQIDRQRQREGEGETYYTDTQSL